VDPANHNENACQVREEGHIFTTMKSFVRRRPLLLSPLFVSLCLLCFCFSNAGARPGPVKFKVIGFYTERPDAGHISFVHEANKWLYEMGKKYHFEYDSTNDWSNLNATFLSGYQVVLFLDTRANDPAQRAAFQQYMENGGAWMGFHFAGFALTPSDFPQDWDWYHNTFLGSGSYVSNTWRPTKAVLRVEDPNHPVTKNLPKTFVSAPNEWYRWSNDLRANPDIDILLAIDSTSFPLGTGPKLFEIWHSGYYPVVWTNRKFRMVYVNMGHDDLDDKTRKETAFTFANPIQDQMIINSLLWLGSRK